MTDLTGFNHSIFKPMESASRDGRTLFLLLDDLTVHRGHFDNGGRNREDWPDWQVEDKTPRVGDYKNTPIRWTVVFPIGWVSVEAWQFLVGNQAKEAK